jgi:hypothetical protein
MGISINMMRNETACSTNTCGLPSISNTQMAITSTIPITMAARAAGNDRDVW